MYFQKLSDIDEVVVIGHSFGNVDLPYFKKIVEKSLINWLCAIIVLGDIPHREKAPKHFEYDGGRVIMAITNTLMIVQTGPPTGICEVRSRENNL